MDFFAAKSKKPYFGGVVGHYSQNEIFSKKYSSVSFLTLKGTLTSWKVSEKFYGPFWRKDIYLLT